MRRVRCFLYISHILEEVWVVLSFNIEGDFWSGPAAVLKGLNLSNLIKSSMRRLVKIHMRSSWLVLRRFIFIEDLC